MSVQVMNWKLGKEQMNVLISIKVCHIEKILNGSKNTNSEKQTRETGQKGFYLYPCFHPENVLYFCAWKNYRGYPAKSLEKIGHLSGLIEK